MIHGVTFRRLGHVGRLGNQMWQIASTIGIGATLGVPVRLPYWDYLKFFSFPKEYFDPVPDDYVEANDTRVVRHIDKRAREYLQDWNLWRDIDALIRQFFTPSAEAMELLTQHPAWKVLSDPTVSVHVRRGDNLRELTDYNGFHPLKGPDYYQAAIEKMPADAVRLVFSDDPAWCRQNLGDSLEGDIRIIEGVPRTDDMKRYWKVPVLDWIDLQLMTFCSYHVISNSTFAWWGAYLSTDREPIYPTPWFGHQLGYINAQLMFPETWRALPYRTDWKG